MSEMFSQVSRRNMLAGLAASSVAMSASPALAGGNPAKKLAASPGGKVSLALATDNDWSAQVGSLFTAETGQVLQLVSVQKVYQSGARPAWMRQSGFVARFSIVAGVRTMAEGTYRFRHKEGSTFDMHVAPAGRAQTAGMIAVFN